MTSKETTNNIKIWETPYRAKGLQESVKAFESFIIVRDMGIKRSLKTTAETTNTKYETVRNWSFKYKWSDRINEMNKYKIQEKNRINKEIQRKELDRINKRLDAKSELISTLINVLIDNVENIKDSQLDIKEFSNMLNLVSKVENMNIADLENIKNLEKQLIDNDADAETINAMIDNFNVLLAVNNSNIIDEYNEDLKDDEY